MTLIVPVVFGAIFLLLYMLFGSVPETLALILPCLYAYRRTAPAIRDGV